MSTAQFAKAVTPSDTVAITPNPDFLQVGVGGTVTVRPDGADADVQFTVPAGGHIFCRVTHVRATGTSASAIVGLNY